MHETGREYYGLNFRLAILLKSQYKLHLVPTLVLRILFLGPKRAIIVTHHSWDLPATW